MWSGTTALKNIDKTLQTIRNDVVRLDTQLSELTTNMAENQRQRLKIVNDIATVRLVEIESGDLHKGLNSADREAVKILQQRESAQADVTHQIDELNTQIEQLEQIRKARLEQVNLISQEIVDTESKVQSKLKVDENYLAQLDKARVAESVAAEAQRKAKDAQSDLEGKAKPYQADSLFMYLWERDYGTTQYAAGLFARFMDGFVARTINYEPARVNYWNLTEIPKRLAEHAQGMDILADEQIMALQQIEKDSLNDAGIREIEVKLKTERELLDQIDDELESTEGDLNTHLQKRSKFIAGEDEYIVQCLGLLTAALDHQDLRAIHRYVQATHSPTDDQLLIELQGVDERVQVLSDGLTDLRMSHDRKLDRLKELELVRRNFKNSRFDDVRSGFGNESILAGVLAQFIQGVVDGSDLWRVIERNQRYRDVGSIPDFGSGGLGQIGDLLGGNELGKSRRKKRGSSWHFPKPRGGGGGFKIPRGGGRRGGGFKTGGGF